MAERAGEYPPTGIDGSECVRFLPTDLVKAGIAFLAVELIEIYCYCTKEKKTCADYQSAESAPKASDHTSLGQRPRNRCDKHSRAPTARSIDPPPRANVRSPTAFVNPTRNVHRIRCGTCAITRDTPAGRFLSDDAPPAFRCNETGRWPSMKMRCFFPGRCPGLV